MALRLVGEKALPLVSIEEASSTAGMEPAADERSQALPPKLT